MSRIITFFFQKRHGLTVLVAGLALLCSQSLYSQTVIFSSDFETWNGNVPSGWVGAKTTLEADSIMPYTASAHSGTHSCRLVNRESSHKRFTTQAVNVIDTVTYTINFWVRGHGNIRTGLYDNRPGGTSGYAPYNAYINVNSSAWMQQTQTIQAGNTTNIAEFIFSVQYSAGDIDDIQIDDVEIIQGGGGGGPSLSIQSPAGGSTVYASSVNAFFNAGNFVIGNPGTGIDGHIHWKLDNNAPQMHYSTAPIQLSGLATGSHKLVLTLVDNNHNPLSPAVADSVTFTVGTTPPNLHTVYEIQYTTDTSGNSPFLGSQVSVFGIVTGVHSQGFFMQSGHGPWSGLYVYYSSFHPERGDSVLVMGTVNEYYKMTELGSVSNVTVITKGNPSPQVSAVDCAGMNTEPYEGVLVKVSGVTCVNPAAGFGMWKIQDATDTAKVHNLIFAYTPILGSHYDVTGPVYFSFDEYKIEPRDAGDVILITGIGEQEMTGVGLYPNPANDKIYIRNAAIAGTIVIIDYSGKEVMCLQAVPGNDQMIDIGSFTPGMYFLVVRGWNGSLSTMKFVKR